MVQCYINLLHVQRLRYFKVLCWWPWYRVSILSLSFLHFLFQEFSLNIHIISIICTIYTKRKCTIWFFSWSIHFIVYICTEEHQFIIKKFEASYLALDTKFGAQLILFRCILLSLSDLLHFNEPSCESVRQVSQVEHWKTSMEGK